MVTQQNVSVNRAAETSSVTTQKVKVIASVVIVPEEPLMVITPDNKVVNRALKLAPKGAGHQTRLSGRLINTARKLGGRKASSMKLGGWEASSLVGQFVGSLVS